MLSLRFQYYSQHPSVRRLTIRTLSTILRTNIAMFTFSLHEHDIKVYEHDVSVRRKPNMFNLPSLVSLVFAFTGLSSLCYHLFFAFEIFLFIGRHSAADRLPWAVMGESLLVIKRIIMTEVNKGRKIREGLNFCIIFLSYNKEVNHSKLKRIQGNRLKNDPSIGP